MCMMCEEEAMYQAYLEFLARKAALEGGKSAPEMAVAAASGFVCDPAPEPDVATRGPVADRKRPNAKKGPGGQDAKSNSQRAPAQARQTKPKPSAKAASDEGAKPAPKSTPPQAKPDKKKGPDQAKRKGPPPKAEPYAQRNKAPPKAKPQAQSKKSQPKAKPKKKSPPKQDANAKKPPGQAVFILC